LINKSENSKQDINMQFIITLIHFIVCIALIMIVLLQRGKGADMGSAFGGASQTVFGSAGATPFLGKITAAAAIIFMLTCLSLAYMHGKGTSSSIMEGVSGSPAAQNSATPGDNK
jgi:preprotein translocase subunit SecG